MNINLHDKVFIYFILLQIYYNLGAIAACEGYYKESIVKFEHAIRKLSFICNVPGEKFSDNEISYKFQVHASTKYMIFNIHRSMDVITIDDILMPATLLSQCLSAKAEAVFLSSTLSGGAFIQQGNIFPDNEGTPEAITLSNELSNSFSALLNSHPNLRVSLIGEDNKPLPKKKGKIKRQASSFGGTESESKETYTLTTALPPQGIPGQDSSPDLIKTQQLTAPFRRLLGVCSGGDEPSLILAEATNNLKMNRAPPRPAKGSSDVATTYRTSSAEQLLQPSVISATKSAEFLKIIDVIPTGSNSARAEMLIVPDTFSVGAVTATDSDVASAMKKGNKAFSAPNKFESKSDDNAGRILEWALLVSEGAGMGPLGFPMIAMPKDYTDRQRNRERDRIRAEAKGAQSKIVEFEQNNRVGTPLLRMTLYSTLAKLCMHQGLRTEANTYIAEFETLAAIMGLPRPLALARKFRADFEEWHGEATQPLTASQSMKFKRLQALLRHLRLYYDAARVCHDDNIHRDACKKLMNAYIEISNTPDPLGTPPREFATEFELAALTPMQVLAGEESDILLLKQFSKARAKYFLRKMKEIGKSQILSERTSIVIADAIS